MNTGFLNLSDDLPSIDLNGTDTVRDIEFSKSMTCTKKHTPFLGNSPYLEHGQIALSDNSHATHQKHCIHSRNTKYQPRKPRQLKDRENIETHT